jgi:hypothetical protein
MSSLEEDRYKKNLIDEIPQIAVRARVYKLSDDGASDQAITRRRAKDLRAREGEPLAYHQKRINEIKARQSGSNPLREEIAQKWISDHEKAIRAIESDFFAIKPEVRVVPPISRRVRREDRKRKRIDKSNDK